MSGSGSTHQSTFDATLIGLAPTPIAVYEPAPPYKRIAANDAYCSRFSVTGDPGGSIADLLRLLQPDDSEEVAVALRRVAAGTGDVMLRELRVETPGQSCAFWNWSFYPVISDDVVSGIGHLATDVTEQRHTEEALRHSENRYRELVQGANSAIVRWNRDKTITFLNDYGLRFFGYTRDEIVGQPITILLAEKSAGIGFADLVAELLSHPERHVTNTNVNVLRDGSKVWMNWSNRPIRNENGEVEEILAVGNDVTGQQIIEDALRQAREHLSVAITQLPAILWTTDKDLRYTFVAGSALDTVGVSPEDLVGLRMQDMPREGNDIVIDACRRALEGEPVRYEDRYKEIYFHSCVLPLKDADGEIIGTVGVALDISDNKRIEEQMRQRAEEVERVMEAAPIAIWVAYDPECRNITGNRTADKFYEAADGENVSATTTSIRRFFSGGRELTADQLPMQQAAALNKEIRDAEFEVEMPGGTRRKLWGYAVPLRTADGEVRGVVGAFVDVTQQREMETHKREFYRRTILGATGGKLVICEPEEIERLMEPCQRRASWRISDIDTLRRMREGLMEEMVKSGVPRETQLSLLSCAVEAATNAVKHAGNGEASLCRRNGKLVFTVADSGPGIAAMALPDVALTYGYSTSGTLGMGYKVMLHFADRVYLATGPKGTTVAVELDEELETNSDQDGSCRSNAG